MVMKLVVLLLLAIALAMADSDTEYYALIDAGSSGSRVYIYSWQSDDILGSFQEVAHKRLQPGLSSLLSSPEQIASQVASLCTFAESHIPSDNHETTHIAIMATAGLRLLPLDHQERIMGHAFIALERCSFDFHRSVSGVISGELEAVYDWVAINTIFSTLDGKHIGAIDLGGASTQIALPLSQAESSGCSSASVSVPKTGGVHIYAKSLLGFGLLSAMQKMLEDEKITMPERIENTIPQFLDEATPIPHPCLSPGVYPVGVFDDYYNVLHGGGSFDECQAHLRRVFTPMLEPQLSKRCLTSQSFSGLIAMDNYPKVLRLLHLNSSTPSLQQIEAGGRRLCATAWRDICAANPTAPDYRCQKACFGTAYISFLLRDVYGLLDDSSADSAQAISIDFRVQHRNFEINWPVGAAVHQLLHKLQSQHVRDD